MICHGMQTSQLDVRKLRKLTVCVRDFARICQTCRYLSNYWSWGLLTPHGSDKHFAIDWIMLKRYSHIVQRVYGARPR